MKKKVEEPKAVVKSDGRQRKVVVKFGYEYTLVAVEGRQDPRDSPNFMGYSGFALQTIKKMKK